VSEKHANFIVNLGGATAGDVLALMREVERKSKINSDDTGVRVSILPAFTNVPRRV